MNNFEIHTGTENRPWKRLSYETALGASAMLFVYATIFLEL